jgi:uncharacterized damage-inducible protein DinB
VNSFYADYLLNLKEIHDDIRNTIMGLLPEELDWSSGTEMNSLTALIVHLIGAERYWIGDVIFGESSGRDRDSEFMARGLSDADLVSRLEEIETYIQKALERLSLQELQEKRISPRNGREVTVGWALCHALKHTALHSGHIQLTRQMWEGRSAGSKEN